MASGAEWICLNGATASNGLQSDTTVPVAECPFITENCGKNKDLTYVGTAELQATGLHKGEVCAYELDPTIRKPVINLSGDENATFKIKEVDIEVPDQSIFTDANSSVNFLKGSD